MQSTTLILLALLACLAAAQATALKKTPRTTTSKSTEIRPAETSDGLTSQTGYEGFFPPDQHQEQGHEHQITNDVTTKMNHLVIHGSKAISVIAEILLSLFFSFLGTICTLTSLCNLSANGLHLSKKKHIKKQIKELARTYLTHDNMETVSQLVKSAIEMYPVMGSVEY